VPTTNRPAAIGTTGGETGTGEEGIGIATREVIGAAGRSKGEAGPKATGTGTTLNADAKGSKRKIGRGGLDRTEKAPLVNTT
jgi:hypothetical protein